MTSRNERLAPRTELVLATHDSNPYSRYFIFALTAGLSVFVISALSIAVAQTPGSTPNPFDIKIAAVIQAEPGVETPIAVEIGLSGPAAADTALLLRGLPRDTRLTQGLTDGTGTWAVPVSKLKQLAIIVPAGASGRSTIALELLGSTGTRLSQATTALVITLPSFVKPEVEPPPIKVQGQIADEQRTALATAAIGAVKGYSVTLPQGATIPPVAALPAAPLPPPLPPPATPAVGLSGAERDKALQHMARGDALLREGNVSAARLFYERAAAQGWAPAALALGSTYDAAELARMGVLGVAPDPAKARAWYEKARDLGALEASARLGRAQ